MDSIHPVYSKNAPIVCLLIPFWFIYLSTLSPTVFYRDTPEFVNTAFTLGISHPAGFPIYNLMAKVVTFFPMGSVPFKINLFSSLMGCLALGALYLASITFLKVLFGSEHSNSFTWPALLPVGFLAACIPFWGNTMLAEVYTLHTLFTILVILCLLKWSEKEDVRYLYSGALVYGLSAGNHGTVAFYLPAILILFFFRCRKERWRHLSFCVSFFILGFSIYLYLPIRSLAEPTFDWGNPETLEGFLFQVTDRKDSQMHFSAINSSAIFSASETQGSASALNWITVLISKIKHVGLVFLKDVYHNLSMVSVVGFLAGAILCFRKSLPLFVFCAVIVGSNSAFFISWRGEAYLPSYVIVTLFTALAIYWFLFTSWWQKGNTPAGVPNLKYIMRSSKLVGVVLLFAIGLSIPWSLWKNFGRVDHSWNYLPESLTRKVYLTLPDKAVFITGLSWFFYNYNQDVRRLRDDVTAVSVWDLISPHRSGLITPKRYPHLFLPNTGKYDFNSLTGISDYTQEFFEQNAKITPVILEQIITLYEQTELTSKWQPYRNALLLYKSKGAIQETTGPYSYEQSWQELRSLMNAELVKPESGRDRDWINIPGQWIVSMRDYFHSTEEYALERDALELLRNFLGQHGSRWHFLYLDNLILDRRMGKAEIVLNKIGEQYPNSFEFLMGQGLLFKAQGNREKAIEFFSQAVALRPESFRAYLEIASTFRQLNNQQSTTVAMTSAQMRLKNMRQAIQFKAERRRIESSFR